MNWHPNPSWCRPLLLRRLRPRQSQPPFSRAPRHSKPPLRGPRRCRHALHRRRSRKPSHHQRRPSRRRLPAALPHRRRCRVPYNHRPAASTRPALVVTAPACPSSKDPAGTSSAPPACDPPACLAYRASRQPIWPLVEHHQRSKASPKLLRLLPVRRYPTCRRSTPPTAARHFRRRHGRRSRRSANPRLANPSKAKVARCRSAATSSPVSARVSRPGKANSRAREISRDARSRRSAKASRRASRPTRPADNRGRNCPRLHRWNRRSLTFRSSRSRCPR